MNVSDLLTHDLILPTLDARTKDAVLPGRTQLLRVRLDLRTPSRLVHPSDPLDLQVLWHPWRQACPDPPTKTRRDSRIGTSPGRRTP